MSFVLMVAACHHRCMSSAPQFPVGDSTLVIRVATPFDDAELQRLAALDSARPLGGTVIVAQSDGRIDAALPPDDGRAIPARSRPSAGPVPPPRRPPARRTRCRTHAPAPAR